MSKPAIRRRWVVYDKDGNYNSLWFQRVYAEARAKEIGGKVEWL